MSDPQLERQMEAKQQPPGSRLKFLLVKKEILEEVRVRAGKLGADHYSFEDYYNSWSELYAENELAIGIEAREVGGGRSEV